MILEQYFHALFLMRGNYVKKIETDRTELVFWDDPVLVHKFLYNNKKILSQTPGSRSKNSSYSFHFLISTEANSIQALQCFLPRALSVQDYGPKPGKCSKIWDFRNWNV